MDGGIPFLMRFRGPWYTQTAARSSPAPLRNRQLQQPPNSGRGGAEPGPGTETETGPAPGAASAPRADMAEPETTPEVSDVYKCPGGKRDKEFGAQPRPALVVPGERRVTGTGLSVGSRC